MSARKPSIFLWLTSLSILLFILTGAANLDDYGMGWDEVTRWKSGDLKVDYYIALFDGDPATHAKPMGGDRYPGLFDITLSVLHRMTGADRMLLGHGLSLAFATLGLAATAWLANTLFGARVAFLSTLLLAVLPNFYGHAMMNPKDIPFMATYSLGLATVFAVIRRTWDVGKVPLRDAILAGIAIGMAAACRVPGIVLLVLAAVAWAVILIRAAWLRHHHFQPARDIFAFLIAVASCGLSALLVLFVFFPRLHFALFSSITKVSSSLHSSAAEIPLLFRGEAMNAADGPATYALHFLLISTPVWILLMMVAGLIFVGVALRNAHPAEPGRFLLTALFLLYAAFPWLYVLLTNPALHNGIRHMLWGIPPLIILAAFGCERIYLLGRQRFPAARWAAPGVLAAFIALQAGQLYRSHPYQYVYFNFLAGDPATVINRYEAEYWFTSTRHLLEALPRVATPGTPARPVPIRVSGPLDAARPFVPAGFVLVDSFADAHYYLANTTFRSDLLAEGETLHTIERNGIPIGVIKRLSR